MRLYKCLSTIVLICTFCAIKLYGQEPVKIERQIEGIVTDAETKKTIPFATIYLPEVERGVVSDVDGKFTIQINSKGSVQLRISSLGYAMRDLTINENEHNISVPLKLQSIGLAEFTVSAKYTNPLGSEARIDQEALEYINPISIQDVFVLLPGGTVGANNIHGRKLMSSRQAGTDESTSFGMGVSVDGIPLQNDGYRIQMGNYTGGSNSLQVNTGVDLRTISTDHIESITITKGISSAKEGNLSSGSIKVTSKKGKTPLRSRIKIDPLNKLAYVGKGVVLSEKLGTLHTGIDYIESSNDLRNIKSAYKRITAQINYDNQFFVLGKKVDFNLRGSYVISLNNRKNDEVIRLKDEMYKTNYSRYSVSTKILAHINSPIVDELELLFSSDYTKDVLKHRIKVENVSVQISQSSTVEGESEAKYLPQQYHTYYELENKPLTLFGTLTASKQTQLSENLQLSALLGTSISHTKNHGEGAIVNPEMPPFPSSSFIRPRANYDIPALVNNASFVETKLKYRNRESEVNASLGARATTMFNLPQNYHLNNHTLLEPRLQLAYTHRKVEGEDQILSNTLRVGFGVENKLPSIDFLYPDKIYKDFVAFNGYFTDASKRLVLVNTKILDPVNPEVRENKNKKIELGWDLKYKKFDMSISVFREAMKGGIEYFTEYLPVSYTAYKLKDDAPDRKPTMDDLNPYNKKDFTMNRRPTNSSKVIKKGLEYRFLFSKLDIIKSDIELNGAYYHTLYTSGVPVMHRPAITQNSQLFPYVGYYDGFDKQYSERFNTNIWINTHLPLWKLMFSNFVQFTWIESYRMGKDVDVYPTRLMDLDGNVYPVTPQDIENNWEYSPLIRDFSAAIYNKESRPISMLWNVKLTKEFNKHIKLSFFANNLLQIAPSYKTRFMRTQRNTQAPFFGTEIIINLF